MEYRINTVNISKAILNDKGIMEPLCDDCVTPDCSNPIRETVISVLGVPQKMRLFVVNNVYNQVVECEGYAGPRVVHHAKTQGSNLNVQTEGTRDTGSQEESQDID